MNYVTIEIIANQELLEKYFKKEDEQFVSIVAGDPAKASVHGPMLYLDMLNVMIDENPLEFIYAVYHQGDMMNYDGEHIIVSYKGEVEEFLDTTKVEDILNE